MKTRTLFCFVLQCTQKEHVHNKKQDGRENIFLSDCLFVCPLVSNKRKNDLTDRVQILCGTSHDPREIYKCSQFQKDVSKKFNNFVKFLKSTVRATIKS